MERDSDGYPLNDPPQEGQSPSTSPFYLPYPLYPPVSYEAGAMNIGSPASNSNMPAEHPIQVAPALSTGSSTQGIYKLIKGFTDLGDALHEHITQVCGSDVANSQISLQAAGVQRGGVNPTGHLPLAHQSSSSSIRRRPAHPNLRTPYGSVQEASNTARARRMTGSAVNISPSGQRVDSRFTEPRLYQEGYIPQSASGLHHARTAVFGDRTLAHRHTMADGPRQQFLSSLHTMSSIGLERNGISWENVVTEFNQMAPGTHLTIQEAQNLWNSLPDVRASYIKEQEKLKEEQMRKRMEEEQMKRMMGQEQMKRMMGQEQMKRMMGQEQMKRMMGQEQMKREEQIRRQIEKKQMMWQMEEEEEEEEGREEEKLGVEEPYSSDIDDYNLEIHCCGTDDSSEGGGSETSSDSPDPDQDDQPGESDTQERGLTLKAHQSLDYADDIESLSGATGSEAVPRPHSSRAYTHAQEQWMLSVVPTLLVDEMKSSERWSRIRELFFDEFHELKTADSLRARWRILRQRVAN